MTKKRIILSKHAIERMLKRGVSHEDVRKTIDHPTLRFPLEKDNTQEFRRKVSRYDKKGIIPRLLKPVTGAVAIYNEEDEEGNLRLVHKNGKDRLKIKRG